MVLHFTGKGSRIRTLPYNNRFLILTKKVSFQKRSSNLHFMFREETVTYDLLACEIAEIPLLTIVRKK